VKRALCWSVERQGPKAVVTGAEGFALQVLTDGQNYGLRTKEAVMTVTCPPLYYGEAAEVHVAPLYVTNP
jgi:hypothetical protein